MPRLPALSADEKTTIVLDLLAGRVKLSAAAAQAGVSVQSVCLWRRQFIEAGQQGLQPSARDSEAARRERQLRSEIRALKAALGEAHLHLRNYTSPRVTARRFPDTPPSIVRRPQETTR
ncbi:transposase [Streptomyces rochei]|uniref:transposase n=1 Tax=Streptomyces rochei TaxID=1928 RepID=UPI0036B41F88